MGEDVSGLNPELCTACGDCALVCPLGEIHLESGIPVLPESEECGACGLCEAVCPAGAIAMTYEIVTDTPNRADIAG